MDSVRTVWNRVAATVALTALLACSGMGLCWRLAARTGHECCAKTDTMSAPAKACDSPLASVDVAKVLAPEVVVALFTARLPEVVQRAAAGAFAPSFAVKPPPFVLRI